MDVQIRTGGNQDIEELVHLSILAWEPVLDSYRQILGPTIYAIIYPDWKTKQREIIETYCREREDRTVLIAEVGGSIAGFLVYELNHENQIGEVQLLAVHPDHQKRGIAAELNNMALIEMKESGMILAVVDTGGDPAHASARRAYERAGYSALPLVRYYKDL
jgi:ribosomal protein S18 acetylase RimI-like enzyme